MFPARGSSEAPPARGLRRDPREDCSAPEPTPVSSILARGAALCNPSPPAAPARRASPAPPPPPAHRLKTAGTCSSGLNRAPDANGKAPPQATRHPASLGQRETTSTSPFVFPRSAAHKVPGRGRPGAPRSRRSGETGAHGDGPPAAGAPGRPRGADPLVPPGPSRVPAGSPGAGAAARTQPRPPQRRAPGKVPPPRRRRPARLAPQPPSAEEGRGRQRAARAGTVPGSPRRRQRPSRPRAPGIGRGAQPVLTALARGARRASRSRWRRGGEPRAGGRRRRGGGSREEAAASAELAEREQPVHPEREPAAAARGFIAARRAPAPSCQPRPAPPRLPAASFVCRPAAASPRPDSGTPPPWPPPGGYRPPRGSPSWDCAQKAPGDAATPRCGARSGRAARGSRGSGCRWEEEGPEGSGGSLGRRAGRLGCPLGGTGAPRDGAQRCG